MIQSHTRQLKPDNSNSSQESRAPHSPSVDMTQWRRERDTGSNLQRPVGSFLWRIFDVHSWIVKSSGPAKSCGIEGMFPTEIQKHALRTGSLHSSLRGDQGSEGGKETKHTAFQAKSQAKPGQARQLVRAHYVSNTLAHVGAGLSDSLPGNRHSLREACSGGREESSSSHGVGCDSWKWKAEIREHHTSMVSEA